MTLFKNERQYAQLLVTPHRRSITVKPGQLVEGSFFSRYSTLTEVPEGTAGELVWSQTAWSNSKMPPYVKEELGKRGLLPAEPKAPEPELKPEPVTPEPVVSPEPEPVVKPEPTPEPAEPAEPAPVETAEEPKKKTRKKKTE